MCVDDEEKAVFGPDQFLLDPMSPQFPGLTLADICKPESSKPVMFREDPPHMQNAVMRVTQAMAAALQCDGVIEDTHARDMQHPDCRPDILCLSSPDLLHWSNVTWVAELMLGTSKGEVETMRGQLVQRTAAVFSHQPERRTAIAIGMTMNAIEVSDRDVGYGRTAEGLLEALRIPSIISA